MDCYFHSNVPSVAPCTDCGKAICATCRSAQGTCPSCRLAQKIDAAAGSRERLIGEVPPRRAAPPPPGPPQQPTITVNQAVAVHTEDPVESRALIALGFPLWPLALLGLFDRKQSRYLRRQTYNALGFNIGIWAFGAVLTLLANVPGLGISATILLPFLVPLFLVASVFFGIKVWHGEEVRVPIVSDWLDERLPVK